MALFWLLLTTLACIIDYSGVLQAASDDPFDQPHLIGRQGRARRVCYAYKNKVANIAATGDIFRSGRAVIRGAKIFGRSLPATGEASANKWVAPLCYRYLHRLQEVFLLSNLIVPILSLAWDATRMSGLDTLVSTVYSPFLDVAGWCPPQVLLSLFGLCVHLQVDVLQLPCPVVFWQSSWPNQAQTCSSWVRIDAYALLWISECQRGHCANALGGPEADALPAGFPVPQKGGWCMHYGALSAWCVFADSLCFTTFGCTTGPFSACTTGPFSACIAGRLVHALRAPLVHAPWAPLVHALPPPLVPCLCLGLACALAPHPLCKRNSHIWSKINTLSARSWPTLPWRSSRDRSDVQLMPRNF